MAYKKPIVTGSSTDLEQLQASDDGLDLGGFQIPDAIGSAGQVLKVPAAGTILEWTDPNANDNLLSLTNGNAGTINIGQPVYISAADTVDLAKADAAATSKVFGLVSDTTIDTTDPGNILYRGILTATTGQWDAVTGQTGGLTAGSEYFLDPTTAGKLTTTKPSTATQVVKKVGVAISTTKMKLELGSSILL